MLGPEVIKTRVGIVGGGPAGLMLSHLLAEAGIDNVVVDNREHETIRTTHRAGILEHGSVSMLVESGVSDRVLTAGHKHEGIDLRFGGESHRIDFTDLVGEAVWLYPQNEVFVDLAAARRRDGGDVRFGVSDTAVSDLTSHTPRISFTDADGVAREIHAEILVGADGSQGITKWAIPSEHRTDNFIEYPFAWFGILCEASPSAEELIYAHSQHGFALISQRDANIQRMYFQCSPDEDAAAWSEDQIWAELRKRVDDPDDLELGATINGEVVQHSRTSQMIFTVPELIEHLSRTVELFPGDVLFTGTPPGVGVGRTPPRFLGPGDVLRSHVDGFGELVQSFTSSEETRLAQEA
jgi:p-hydroxybenzoate 3-monooxygenase